MFTGKERDSESGLDYFGARYFGSALGRFTSPDPLMASAHASNPQSWNRYAYALNNPLRFVDPDGMDVSAACAQDKNCQIVVKVNVGNSGTSPPFTKSETFYRRPPHFHFMARMPRVVAIGEA
jgi:RHS repeat-associated protein